MSVSVKRHTVDNTELLLLHHPVNLSNFCSSTYNHKIQPTQPPV